MSDKIKIQIKQGYLLSPEENFSVPVTVTKHVDTSSGETVLQAVSMGMTTVILDRGLKVKEIR